MAKRSRVREACGWRVADAKTVGSVALGPPRVPFAAHGLTGQANRGPVFGDGFAGPAAYVCDIAQPTGGMLYYCNLCGPPPYCEPCPSPGRLMFGEPWRAKRRYTPQMDEVARLPGRAVGV